MKKIEELKEKVIGGGYISKEEAMQLTEAPLEELCRAANEIRETLCGNMFDFCTIINGKSGKCSEDCKYCAQSAYYHTNIEEYPLLHTDEIVRQAKYNDERGVLRYSIVTSGKRLNPQELADVCESIQAIRRQTNIHVCVSLGLLQEADFCKLKEAGATRVHCNLEASRSYFPSVCSTHTFEEKIETLKAAQRAGLSVCSGGIMGLGETMEDRIEMALELRELGVSSIPVNFLNPIPGTPFESNPLVCEAEKRRIVAIYRFLLPKASIRLAGGRGLMPDQGEACFQSGANAAISGDMLTTSGISIERDRKLLESLGYQVGFAHE